MSIQPDDNYTVLVTVIRGREPTALKEEVRGLTIDRAADMYTAAVEALRAELTK